MGLGKLNMIIKKLLLCLGCISIFAVGETCLASTPSDSDLGYGYFQAEDEQEDFLYGESPKIEEKVNPIEVASEHCLKKIREYYALIARNDINIKDLADGITDIINAMREIITTNNIEVDMLPTEIEQHITAIQLMLVLIKGNQAETFFGDQWLQIGNQTRTMLRQDPIQGLSGTLTTAFKQHVIQTMPDAQIIDKNIPHPFLLPIALTASKMPGKLTDQRLEMSINNECRFHKKTKHGKISKNQHETIGSNSSRTNSK